jgi:hypothetical protein
MYENAMQLVTVLQALLKPTIGIVTAYIAWRQYHDGKIKLDLDRYEKRLVAYKAVRAVCLRHRRNWTSKGGGHPPAAR